MGWAAYIVPVLLCSVFAASGLPRVDPLVDTKVGLIKGLAASDGEYSLFLGIPYATVDPLNPFGPSIPHSGFESTFDAVDDSAVCPQREEYNNTLVGTWDCLNLNVYVPSTATSRNPRPVMVWIHGGGFEIGFGARFAVGPKYLVKHDVILVTINYRLGSFGFLCPDIPEVPGNQGLKDQLTALRWVKNNIDAFGGDSNKITIFGESAGGVSVDYHLMYSQENLFNYAIMQSGTAHLPFAMRDSNPNGPLILAEHLGFVTDDVRSALDFLRTIDPGLIVAATEATNIEFRTCVEKEYDNVERFITNHPANMNIAKARTVPILIGFNSNEMGHTFGNLGPDDYKNFQDKFYGIAEVFDFDDEYLSSMEKLVRQFFIGDEEINEDVLQEIVEFSTDLQFIYPTYRTIRQYLENGATNIYHYMFSYNGDRNLGKTKYNATGVSGAAHEDELGYLFDPALYGETPTPEDQLTIDRITTLWSNFAKYGNPTPEVSDILPELWPTVSEDTMYYMSIGSEVTVKKRPYHERMAFWELFFKTNQQYLRGTQEN